LFGRENDTVAFGALLWRVGFAVGALPGFLTIEAGVLAEASLFALIRRLTGLNFWRFLELVRGSKRVEARLIGEIGAVHFCLN
jgi:hypothetical protein